MMSLSRCSGWGGKTFPRFAGGGLESPGGLCLAPPTVAVADGKQASALKKKQSYIYGKSYIF